LHLFEGDEMVLREKGKIGGKGKSIFFGSLLMQFRDWNRKNFFTRRNGGAEGFTIAGRKALRPYCLLHVFENNRNNFHLSLATGH
jgi:hypothetical protein